MIAVTVLSAVVYGHHMFVTGMNPLLGQSFMLLTLIISVPAEVLFLNWLHTIWKGSIRLTTPMLFALGMVFVFGLGGLTGLFLGTISTDIYLHDTMFVVGHFHLTMAAASFLGSFAAIYFWFPKMFGRHDERDARQGRTSGSRSSSSRWSSAGSSSPATRASSAGSTTRTSTRSSQHLAPLNRLDELRGVRARRRPAPLRRELLPERLRRARRPSRTRGRSARSSGRMPSPPPHHNFDVIPTVVRGPHEFANPEVKKAARPRLDRPDRGAARRARRTARGRRRRIADLPRRSFASRPLKRPATRALALARRIAAGGCRDIQSAAIRDSIAPDRAVCRARGLIAGCRPDTPAIRRHPRRSTGCRPRRATEAEPRREPCAHVAHATEMP